ncbi:MAG TPA: hypothetical protein VF540_02455 [Segetibacter sp.]|jgi:lipoprotein-anchoring transpeptidase ErfK/SrfK
MSAEQTVQIYKLLQKYFQNEEDATKVVAGLQQIIDRKFEDKKTELATKSDMQELRFELVNKLNDHFKWTVATIFSVGALIVALIKWL